MTHVLTFAFQSPHTRNLWNRAGTEQWRHAEVEMRERRKNELERQKDSWKVVELRNTIPRAVARLVSNMFRPPAWLSLNKLPQTVALMLINYDSSSAFLGENLEQLPAEIGCDTFCRKFKNNYVSGSTHCWWGLNEIWSCKGVCLYCVTRIVDRSSCDLLILTLALLSSAIKYFHR